MSDTDVIQLAISLESKSPSRAAFNRGLVLAKNAPLVSWGDDRIKPYTLNAAGRTAVRTAFGVDSEEYDFHNQMMQQRRQADFIYFGLRQAASDAQKTIALAGAMNTGHEISFVLNGKSVTQAYTTDVTTTYSALESKIEACPGIDTCTVSSNSFAIVAEADWLITIDNLQMSVGGPAPSVTTQSAGRTVFADIGELASISRDFYGLGSLDRSAGHLLELARAAQGTDRLAFGVTADADVLDDTNALDILSRTKALGYDRFSGTYHNKSAEYIDAAVFARFLTGRPGGIVFANKPLIGVTLPGISTDAEEAIKAKNGNYYKDVNGRTWYWPGKTADGGYIDTRRNTDFIYLNMKEDVLDFVEQNDIIPYSQEGANALIGVVRTSLSQRARKEEQVIFSNFSVENVDTSKVSANSRQNRLLPDVRWRAFMQGAIGTIQIDGVISI